MEDSKSSESENPEAKLEDDPTRFSKSLQELKDLCSQLHYAADYCETSFINADHAHKKNVMENTKEYLCRAVVTVVDHLGSASANLDCRLSNECAVSETEIRIDGLKQRLVTCQQYSHQLGFTKVSWNASFPRYNPRYIFPPTVNHQKSMERLREVGSTVATETISKQEFVAEEEMPLFLYTSNQKPSLIKDSRTEKDNGSPKTSVLPVRDVRDGLSTLPKASNPLFHFESKPTQPASCSSSTSVATEEAQSPSFQRKPRRNSLRWKSMQNNEIATLLRKTKRAI